MLVRGDHLALGVRVANRGVLGRIEVFHSLAGYCGQCHSADRVAEEGHRIPALRVPLSVHHALAGAAKDDPVHGASEKPVGPVRQKIADVDQNGRCRVVLGTRGGDRHRSPGVLVGEDFQARLALETEQHGDGAIIGVGPRADVLDAGVGVGERRVIKPTQGRARCAFLPEMRRCEEVGRVDLIS